MMHLEDLRRAARSLDGKPYGAYKQLAGKAVELGDGVKLVVDRAQVDPFAPPSLAHLEIPRDIVGLPDYPRRIDRVAAADYLFREFADGVRGDRDLSIGFPAQQLLELTAVSVPPEGGEVVVRFTVSLPAAGRRIKGGVAAKILCEKIPDLIEDRLVAVDPEELGSHVELHSDQEYLRGRLPELGLIAFVGNGSVLPREAGNKDTPLKDAVPFESPKSLETTIELPSGRSVTGLGVREGVTVIVGGGYHGKSTLLRAVERGVYPHVAGDGREWVVTRPDAVSIRAEDGRSVTGVDISPFISNLPSGETTESFSTSNASGSTSQAANLAEALEAGSRALIIDEDTSATNFMIRDERMRRLVAADKEPIIPFVDRVRELYERFGVSTLLVAGGSGAFFSVADHVVALDSYRVFDVTEKARAIAAEHPEEPADSPAPMREAARRVPARLEAPGKKKPAQAKGRATIRYGKATIDLGPAEQLVDQEQTRGIAHAIEFLERRLGGGATLPEAVDELERLVDERGLGALSSHRGHPGLFARPRAHEIVAAVNRYRNLKLARG